MSRRTANFRPVCNRVDADGKPAYQLPADGFIQVVPRGYAVGSGPDGKSVRQFVDDRSIELLLKSVANHTSPILVDADHFSHDPEKPTTALAWLDPKTAIARDDGIYAACRITEQGIKDVLGGNYLFTSPEFNFASMEIIEPGLYRPTEWTGEAFTNKPGFRAAKPVTNRDQPLKDETNQAMKKTICALLGLDEATSDDVVINRINALKPLIEKGNKYDALATELQEVHNREVEAIMTANDEVIPKEEEARKTVRALLVTNRIGGMALIEGFKAALADKTPADPLKDRATYKPVHNRENAKVPDDAAKAKSAKEASRATVVKNRANELVQLAKNSGRNLPFSQAFTEADRETPAV